ncbi:hypothetical protein [Actinomadura coerulea]|uniref:hypothetical protein n=1 Tax=Actinomadura coerulea TaxID=46159 RepID=UPI00343F37B3
MRRLGRGRLARFLHRHSRGAWPEAKAEELLATAAATLRLWGKDLDYPDLADDIAIEARLALAHTQELKELDERIAVLFARADPGSILQSVPGIGPILGAQILGRLATAAASSHRPVYAPAASSKLRLPYLRIPGLTSDGRHRGRRSTRHLPTGIRTARQRSPGS